tara:strand:+ start:387 stop:581 length:195 start_codon:yes stop_codon:yes gene_type:complete
MPKLTNVDTHYVKEIAKRHQQIGWRLGILYTHLGYLKESDLERTTVAKLIQEVHDLIAEEATNA